MPFVQRFTVALSAFGTLLLTAGSLRADIVSLNPIADTTLIETDPGANLGGAAFFNAGTTGSGNRNRALMLFSLSEAIPAGSIISSVSLTLDVVREPSDHRASAVFSLRRMRSSWGEGDKTPIEEGSPGLGAPATTGEATWLYRSVGGDPWSAPGGLAGVDFAAVPSATSFVLGIGDPVDFNSGPDLVGDVQFWLDNPGANFGWMLMTETEDLRKSARSFASSEDGGGGPTMVVEFTTVPEPATLLLAGFVVLGAYAWRLTAPRSKGCDGIRGSGPDLAPRRAT